jgi:pantetheine-phosphate adenylyltransferase
MGGTFEPLHEGHKRLINKAVEIGDEIVFGVTSDGMARKRFRSVLPFEIRAENLKRYVEKTYGFTPKIVKIRDCYGNTLDEDFDFLVVSPETYSNAKKINKKRLELGKKTITIVVVDFVLAKDGKPISSTRIKMGEIDRFGNTID